jgi:hypothetical protein
LLLTFGRGGGPEKCLSGIWIVVIECYESLRTCFEITIWVFSGESEAPAELQAAKSHSILLSRSFALPNNEVQLDF